MTTKFRSVSGNRSVRIRAYEVTGFTAASIRIGQEGRCVTSGRIVKMGDQ